MRVTLEALASSISYNFRGSGNPELRIYVLEDFISSDGVLNPRGSPTQKDSWYLKQPCSVTGGYIYIPTLELDSTTDSSNPNARYTARLFTHGGKMIGYVPSDRLASFAVPPVENQTWRNIVEFANATNQILTSSIYLSSAMERQVQAMIDDALGSRDFASASRLGLVYLDHDPNLPNVPIAIGATSSSLPRAGSANMIAGVASITDSSITPSSSIMAGSMGVGVTGTLYPSAIGNGTATIQSTNGADTGPIIWVRYG